MEKIEFKSSSHHHLINPNNNEPKMQSKGSTRFESTCTPSVDILKSTNRITSFLNNGKNGVGNGPKNGFVNNFTKELADSDLKNNYKNQLISRNASSRSKNREVNNLVNNFKKVEKCESEGLKSDFLTTTSTQFTKSDQFVFKLVLAGLFGSIGVPMAAVGITSGEDWLSFLVVASQLLALFLICFAIYHYRAFYIFYKTVFRDIKGGIRYAKILLSVTYAQKTNSTVHKIFGRNVKKHPNKVCFYFEDQVWTFKQVENLSNQVGNYFTKQGFVKNDSVSLFMENRPEYVCIWLGLCKIGVVPALINFNLRLQPLKHSVEVSKSKAVIYGHELSSAVQEIVEMGGGMENIPLFCSGHSSTDTILGKAIDLDSGIKKSPLSSPVPSEPINFTDKLLYIFTSGTTGLPKAAVIKHSRFCFFTMGIHNFIGVSNSEVIYDPLPMYHTAGGMLGVGQALLHGSTAVLRKKFSASAYWKDCIKYNCTAAQYIGEICRYLLIQPPSPEDTQHKVKLMFGNGLRPQIWTDFTKRFNIGVISEFYGATEGNCNIINIDNHVGSVGFISRIAPFIYPVTLIKVDELSGEPIRDHKTGLVLRCKPNEDGELVGRIVDNHPVREFNGYADLTSTNKKIVNDVFRKGDAAFRTGDILRMDEFGYFYFKDRTGDTYRWKGENVSTSEVEACVSNACGLKDAVVFGVSIANNEGKAGMAAILDPDESLDLVKFTENIKKELPVYARPILLRIVKTIDMTGTYKMKKFDIQKEGYDVTKVSDKIYILLNGKYTLVDNEIYSQLIAGQLRV